MFEGDEAYEAIWLYSVIEELRNRGILGECGTEVNCAFDLQGLQEYFIKIRQLDPGLSYRLAEFIGYHKIESDPETFMHELHDALDQIFLDSSESSTPNYLPEPYPDGAQAQKGPDLSPGDHEAFRFFRKASSADIDKENSAALKSCEEGNWLPAVFVPAVDALVIGRNNAYYQGAELSDLYGYVAVRGRIGIRRKGGLSGRVRRGKPFSAGAVTCDGFFAHAEIVNVHIARISRKTSEFMVAPYATESSVENTEFVNRKPADHKVKSTDHKAKVTVALALGGVDMYITVKSAEAAQKLFESWGFADGPHSDFGIVDLIRRRQQRLKENEFRKLRNLPPKNWQNQIPAVQRVGSLEFGVSDGDELRAGVDLLITIMLCSDPDNRKVFESVAKGNACNYIQIGSLVYLLGPANSQEPELVRVIKFAAARHYKVNRGVEGVIRKLGSRSVMVTPFAGAERQHLRLALEQMGVHRVRFSSGENGRRDDRG
ncbi:hypothetical protein [Streptomyces chartreusis]|uniref:hypothetical protein n=1 Tax=Streptomyces chartreusis TaxID=1969 RepID=UPI0033D87226